MDETSLFRLSVIKRHLSQSARNASTATNGQEATLRYSRSDGVLTREQREFYETNGYLLIKNLISREKLEKYANRFKEICSKKIQVPFMTVMKDIAIAKSEFLDGEKAITKIQDFTNDDQLFEYCCLDEVTQYVKSFIGPNVMAAHTMLINKPPGWLLLKFSVF
jgi:phytanoyl-CoA hydroxylase